MATMIFIYLLGMVYTFSYVYDLGKSKHDGKEVIIALLESLVWPVTLGLDKRNK